MFGFFIKNKEAILKALKVLAYVAVVVIEAVKAIISYVAEASSPDQEAA